MQKEAYRSAGDQPRMTKDLMKQSYRPAKMSFDRNAIQSKVRSSGMRPTYRDWETDRKSTRLNSSH